MKLANSQKVKNSWFRKFLKLTNAPRHLDFFPAAKVEKFELERRVQTCIQMRLLLESLPYVILMFTYQNLAGYYVCLLSFQQGKALKKNSQNEIKQEERNGIENQCCQLFSKKKISNL